MNLNITEIIIRIIIMTAAQPKILHFGNFAPKNLMNDLMRRLQIWKLLGIIITEKSLLDGTAQSLIGIKI